MHFETINEFPVSAAVLQCVFSRVVNLLNATDADSEVAANLVRYGACKAALAPAELDAQQQLVLCNATLFPHIKRILCRVAALFIGIASVERTYAGLQRIKTWLS